jgi:hypothetical protein
MARITISFKNTERDQKLYEYWHGTEDKSAEIKSILRREMEKRENNKEETYEKKVVKDNQNVENILNF